MSDILQILQDEKLIGIQWDKVHMQRVLVEVLTLFQNQSKRISELEGKLESTVNKGAIEDVSVVIDKHIQKYNSDLYDVKKLIEANHKDSINSVEELKEWTETSNLGIIAEARRLITNEIENLPKAKPSTPGPDPNMQNRIESIEKTLDGVRLEVESHQYAKANKSKAKEELTSVKIATLETRIENMERRISNYPELESDLNTLILQFPAVTKRLERKVNDCIAAVEGAPGLAKLPITPVPVSNIPDLKPVVIENIKKPEHDNEKNQTKENELSKNTNTKSSPKVITEAFEPVFPKIPSPEISTVLPELDPATIPQTLTPPPEKVTEDKKTITPPISSYPSIKSSKELEKNSSSTFSITTLPTEPVVQVIETHTYKTELSSSMRVVSEIEWIKSMIQQHHDAIRQVQQSIRGQQDNFDTITENVMRINTTHNQRIAQLAQQQLQQHSDNESMRKQILDQMNSLQQRVLTLSTVKPVETIPVHAHPTPSPSLSSRGKQLSPKTSSRKKPESLPPLNNKVQQSTTTDETVQAKKDTERKSTRKKSERKNPEEEEEEAIPEPESPKPRKKFTFTMSHFTANVKEEPVPVMVTQIHQSTSNMNVFSHIDLFTSNPPRPQIKQPIRATQNSDTSTGDGMENLPSPPPSIKERNKQTIIIEGQRIRIPNSQNQRPQSSLEPESIQIPEGMLEDRVVEVARKVMKSLSGTLQDDLNVKAEGMQKNVDKVITLIDGKIDREFVERMFNKFRVMLNEMNDKIDNLQCSFLNWITRDELEIVLQKFLGMLVEANDAAATKQKFNCLLCGKPRSHLNGMIDLEKPLLETSQKPRIRSSVNTSLKKPRKTSDGPLEV